MKKLLVIPIILLLLFFTVACETTPVKTPQNIDLSLSPQRFESEEEFVQALKNNDVSKSFNPDDISCYYRPKIVPEGVSLQYVEVFSTYIMLIYSFDKDKASKDNYKQIRYLWFRYFNNSEEYMNSEIKKGSKKMNLQGKKDNMTFLAKSEFNIEKAKGDTTGWGVSWVQDGQCFSGTVPWNINENDIAKYFDMEKVLIN